MSIARSMPGKSVLAVVFQWSENRVERTKPCKCADEWKHPDEGIFQEARHCRPRQAADCQNIRRLWKSKGCRNVFTQVEIDVNVRRKDLSVL